MVNYHATIFQFGGAWSFIWGLSPQRVTVNGSRLESESFLENLQINHWQTQLVCSFADTKWAFIASMMCLSHFCRVRDTSPSSQSHLKFLRFRSWLGRVRVESQELSSHFESLVSKLESMSCQRKFDITAVFFCYEMAPDELENGT